MHPLFLRWSCNLWKFDATQFCIGVFFLFFLWVKARFEDSQRHGWGVPLSKTEGLIWCLWGWKGLWNLSVRLCVFVHTHVHLWIDKQNRRAAVTRVLKGCMKAAGWGMMDNEEKGERGLREIKCLSNHKQHKGWGIIIVFSSFFHTNTYNNPVFCCMNKQKALN